MDNHEDNDEPFSQLINSYDLEKDLNEAYNNKFHFHWISYSHVFIDELMKSFVYILLNSKINLSRSIISNDYKDYIKRLRFMESLSLLHFNCIIDLELYNDLKKLNSKRNLILHRLIVDIEKVNEINLKEYFDLCNNSIKLLIKSLLEYVRLSTLIQRDFGPVFKDFENKLKESQEKNNEVGDGKKN